MVNKSDNICVHTYIHTDKQTYIHTDGHIDRHTHYIYIYIYCCGALKGSEGERRCSVVQRPLMVRWVFGSISHDQPLSYFSFLPLLHNWTNKGRAMNYPVCGTVHIKYNLLLIGKISGGRRFPLSLPEGSIPYNRE